MNILEILYLNIKTRAFLHFGLTTRAKRVIINAYGKGAMGKYPQCLYF